MTATDIDLERARRAVARLNVEGHPPTYALVKVERARDGIFAVIRDRYNGGLPPPIGTHDTHLMLGVDCACGATR